MPFPRKDLFSLPEQTHYINCAYMSPVPRAVEQAGIKAIQAKRNPMQIGPEAFFEDSNSVRSLFADLIGAPDPRSIAIVPASSYGIATVAKNVVLERGQEVVMLEEQFPSNVYSWRRLCTEQDARLITVKSPDAHKNRGKIWNERVLEAIGPQTALVTLPHAHWADGTLFDLHAIRKAADEHNALLIIDGTQSIGALPFDVKEIRPDAVVCSGYKWLMGPYGIALAYYGPAFSDGVPLEENWITRKGSEEFGGLVAYQDAYQPGAIRYDAGERSSFVLVPMMKAALQLVQQWSPAAIQEYCKDLSEPFLEEARTLGFIAEDRAYRSSHLFGIRMPEGIDLGKLVDTIKSHHISVSVRGSAIRISPHIYNDKGDFDSLLKVLQNASPAITA